MSAETLRRAAALMRSDLADPRRAASRHPDVALALAALLDRLADETGDFLNLDHPALAIANAYLQETP